MKSMKQGLCLVCVAIACIVAGSSFVQADLVVPNAGFESPTLADGESSPGTPVGWTRSSEENTDLGTINPTSSFFAPEAHSGQNVAYVAENCWMQYYTGESFEEGKTYTFSVYAGFTGYGGGGAQIQIRDVTEDDSAIEYGFTAHEDTWELITVSYTAGSSDAGHEIGILIRNFSDGGYVLYDDVTLTPEPATMSLLLAGGLGVICRRRR